jgi:HEAT repeat protein
MLLRAAPPASAAIEPDFLMDSDPPLVIPDPVANFNPRLATLWIAALNRREIDLQRMAAETIARGHEYGIPDLIEAVPALEKIVATGSSHPAARFAAARALVILDSRSSGEKLFAVSQVHGSDLRQLIEPALAEWDFLPARKVWLDRLDSPQTRRRELVLALRGLGKVREKSALPKLLELANDRTRDPDLRLEAAAAAGKLTETGLESQAERLAHEASSAQFVNPLCAIRFLDRHASDEAKRLLIELAGHDEPVVAAAALRRLNELDSALVLPLAEQALSSRDPHVRLEGVSALVEHPTPERVRKLAPLLADPHPEVRRRVCEDLVVLAESPDLHDAVCDAALRVLAEDNWQGQEQAALLLGALEHEPAANRLTQLLPSPRPEVMVAAAWALRKVAVAETIPALIAQARKQTEQRQRESTPGLDDQVAHLFEALGVLKAMDAAPRLREYIPKRPIMGERSRSAAIWGLGLIHAGDRNSELEAQLRERIMDFDDVKPELAVVKQMSAITLARMNGVAEAPVVKSVALQLQRPLRAALALRWAVKTLTGEELPPPEPLMLDQGRWFLEPIP